MKVKLFLLMLKKKKKMANEIKIFSPTRVDLAGGTLNMWPLFNFVGGAKTVNVAIDVYWQVELTKLAGTEVTIESKDLNYAKTFPNLEALLASTDAQLTRTNLCLVFLNQRADLKW